MLPLTHKDSRGCGYRIREKFNSWSRLILSDRNSRNLFLFLLLNLSFAFVELMYGIWTNSLGKLLVFIDRIESRTVGINKINPFSCFPGLISDSFHMFFDCTGLLAGLAASVITKWRANEKYSYGYVRAEVLAGFVNSLFLLFIAFFIMSEAVERAIEPPEVKHERLFVVSVLGLLVNLVGIYAFQHGGAHGHSHGGGGGHGHSHGGGGGGSHGHSHGGGMNHHSHDTHSLLSNHNDHHGHSHGGSDHHHSHGGGEIVSTNSQIMRGVFLHILADTLGSVGVIISAVLMQVFGWMRADPICSMFIALTIGLSTLSLIKESVMVLMQRQPVALDRLLPSCYQKVTGLAGVYSVQEPHFWTLCTDVYVGVIKLEVSKNVDPKYVVQHTRMIFEAIGVRQINIQLDYTAM